MSVFENTLPPFPDGVGDNFVIVYDSSNNTYYLENQFRPTVRYNSSDNYYYISRYSNDGYTQRWEFRDNFSEWIHNQGLLVNNNPMPLTGTNNIIYSSVDLVYNDSVWYAADSPDRLSLLSGSLAVNGSISSSTIYKSLMSDVLPVLGIVFLTVISCLAFRKAWHFFSGILNKG